MRRQWESKLFCFFIGVILGIALVAVGVGAFYKRQFIKSQSKSIYQFVKNFHFPSRSKYKHHIVEDFDQPISAQSGKTFGSDGQFAFELFRNGTFIIDGRSGYAWQKSDNYRDSAFIRSSQPLPKTYKISVVVGDIDYGLEKIEGLSQDPEYTEGPQNENGCYLLTITDEMPQEHHTNIWWHQHRKVVIDVDNNVWGHGMPDPIFMVYFDTSNQLMSLDGVNNNWQSQWLNALRYKSNSWYRVEIEKTSRQFVLSVYDQEGHLLKRGEIDFNEVWQGKGGKEYFVIGDPHENYYQGSLKIDAILMDY